MSAPPDTTDLDAKTARALDRFTVPPISAGFADRVAAAAALTNVNAVTSDMPLARQPRSIAKRRLWRRSRTVVLGVSAIGLVSAAAAATGFFGSAVRDATRSAVIDVPVISRLIAKTDPVAKPAAKVKPKLPTVTRPATAPAKANVDFVPALDPVIIVPPIDAEAARREQRIADRRERIERRVAARINARIAASPQLQSLPPETRADIVQRMTDQAIVRQERRIRMRQAQIARMLETLPQEERAAAVQALRDRWKARRAARERLSRLGRERAAGLVPQKGRSLAQPADIAPNTVADTEMVPRQ